MLAAARFAAEGDEPALLDMNKILRKYDLAKWTVATYLPFLWRPDRHMFLKPEVTKDFATRVGHGFVDDVLGKGLPAGAIIVKENWPPLHETDPPDPATMFWTTMLRIPEGVWDGWYWQTSKAGPGGRNDVRPNGRITRSG